MTRGAIATISIAILRDMKNPNEYTKLGKIVRLKNSE